MCLFWYISRECKKQQHMSRDMRFPTSGLCDQQSLRSACAYAQSEQSLCQSLEYFMSFKLLTEHHLEFLSLQGGCTGSVKSIYVKMPHCWKSHVADHITGMLSADSFKYWYSKTEFPLHHIMKIIHRRENLPE